MNLLYLKYAVEVAACGSINKAAEKLYIGQPNLSRAIKELESSLGVNIFDRSSKGMEITPDGEVFLGYAKSILKQVDSLETMFRAGASNKVRFSAIVPASAYICEAFAAFSRMIRPDAEAKLYYREAGDSDALRSIAAEEYKLGIIRYASDYDKYYKATLDEKGLNYELIVEFNKLLLVNRSSPIADKDTVDVESLRDLVELVAADTASLPALFGENKKEEYDESRRRICVFERAGQYELLRQNPDCFLWSAPVSQELLCEYGLKMVKCSGHNRVLKDMLIWRGDYRLSELDKLFISELCRVKRKFFD